MASQPAKEEDPQSRRVEPMSSAQHDTADNADTDYQRSEDGGSNDAELADDQPSPVLRQPEIDTEKASAESGTGSSGAARDEETWADAVHAIQTRRDRAEYVTGLILSASALSRTMLRIQLQHAGWHIVEAPSLGGAISTIQTRASKFHDAVSVVIVDSFAHEPYDEILRQLRCFRQHVDLVLLTQPRPIEGKGVHIPASNTAVRDAYDIGYNLVIDKPMDHTVVEELTDVFLSATGRWKTQVKSNVASINSNYLRIRTLLSDVTDRFFKDEEDEAGNADDDENKKHGSGPVPIDTHPNFVVLQARYEHEKTQIGNKDKEIAQKNIAVLNLEAQLQRSREERATLQEEVARTRAALRSATSTDVAAEREELISRRNQDAVKLKQLESQTKNMRARSEITERELIENKLQINALEAKFHTQLVITNQLKGKYDKDKGAWESYVRKLQSDIPKFDVAAHNVREQRREAEAKRRGSLSTKSSFNMALFSKRSITWLEMSNQTLEQHFMELHDYDCYADNSTRDKKALLGAGFFKQVLNAKKHRGNENREQRGRGVKLAHESCSSSEAKKDRQAADVAAAKHSGEHPKEGENVQQQQRLAGDATLEPSLRVEEEEGMEAPSIVIPATQSFISHDTENDVEEEADGAQASREGVIISPTGSSGSMQQSSKVRTSPRPAASFSGSSTSGIAQIVRLPGTPGAKALSLRKTKLRAVASLIPTSPSLSAKAGRDSNKHSRARGSSVTAAGGPGAQPTGAHVSSLHGSEIATKMNHLISYATTELRNIQQHVTNELQHYEKSVAGVLTTLVAAVEEHLNCASGGRREQLEQQRDELTEKLDTMLIAQLPDDEAGRLRKAAHFLTLFEQRDRVEEQLEKVQSLLSTRGIARRDEVVQQLFTAEKRLNDFGNAYLASGDFLSYAEFRRSVVQLRRELSQWADGEAEYERARTDRAAAAGDDSDDDNRRATMSPAVNTSGALSQLMQGKSFLETMAGGGGIRTSGSPTAGADLSKLTASSLTHFNADLTTGQLTSAYAMLSALINTRMCGEVTHPHPTASATKNVGNQRTPNPSAGVLFGNIKSCAEALNAKTYSIGDAVLKYLDEEDERMFNAMEEGRREAAAAGGGGGGGGAQDHLTRGAGTPALATGHQQQQSHTGGQEGFNEPVNFDFLNKFLSPDGYYSLTQGSIAQLYAEHHNQLVKLLKQVKERVPLTNLRIVDAVGLEKDMRKTAMESGALAAPATSGGRSHNARDRNLPVGVKHTQFNIPFQIAADTALVQRLAEYYAGETEAQTKLARAKFRRYVENVRSSVESQTDPLDPQGRDILCDDVRLDVIYGLSSDELCELHQQERQEQGGGDDGGGGDLEGEEETLEGTVTSTDGEASAGAKQSKSTSPSTPQKAALRHHPTPPPASQQRLAASGSSTNSSLPTPTTSTSQRPSTQQQHSRPNTRGQRAMNASLSPSAAARQRQRPNTSDSGRDDNYASPSSAARDLSQINVLLFGAEEAAPVEAPTAHLSRDIVGGGAGGKSGFNASQQQQQQQQQATQLTKTKK